MADKKLSSVSAVKDMNYVYAETSSGETVKIAKADLATVVAGQMGFNRKRIYVDSGAEIDTGIKGSGIIWIHNRTTGDSMLINGSSYQFSNDDIMKNSVDMVVSLNTVGRICINKKSTSGTIFIQNNMSSTHEIEVLKL